MAKKRTRHHVIRQRVLSFPSRGIDPPNADRLARDDFSHGFSSFCNGWIAGVPPTPKIGQSHLLYLVFGRPIPQRECRTGGLATLRQRINLVGEDRDRPGTAAAETLVIDGACGNSDLEVVDTDFFPTV